MITKTPEVITKVPAKVVMELTAEQAALICIMVGNVGGDPETSLRAYASEISNMFSVIGVKGFDIHSEEWNLIDYDQSNGNRFKRSLKTNSFFLETVAKLSK